MIEDFGEDLGEQVYAAVLKFQAFRKTIRKPLTEHALDLLYKKLAELRRQGQDPVKCIEQSIMNGYQGIWPVRNEGGRNGQPAESFQERNIRRADEELREVSRRAQQTLQKMGEGIPEPTDRPGSGSRLMLIRLFQQAPISSIWACRAQRLRKPYASSSRCSLPKKLAR
ncbi:MAG: hypothetical protein ABSG77_11275, partial [Candidatus Acidiferrum sp.]